MGFFTRKQEQAITPAVTTPVPTAPTVRAGGWSAPRCPAVYWSEVAHVPQRLSGGGPSFITYPRCELAKGHKGPHEFTRNVPATTETITWRDA